MVFICCLLSKSGSLREDSEPSRSSSGDYTGATRRFIRRGEWSGPEPDARSGLSGEPRSDHAQKGDIRTLLKTATTGASARSRCAGPHVRQQEGLRRARMIRFDPSIRHAPRCPGIRAQDRRSLARPLRSSTTGPYRPIDRLPPRRRTSPDNSRRKRGRPAGARPCRRLGRLRELPQSSLSGRQDLNPCFSRDHVFAKSRIQLQIRSIPKAKS